MTCHANAMLSISIDSESVNAIHQPVVERWDTPEVLAADCGQLTERCGNYSGPEVLFWEVSPRPSRIRRHCPREDFQDCRRLDCADNSRKAGSGADFSTGLRWLQKILFTEKITMMLRNLVSRRNLILISLGLLILAAVTVVLAPQKALADDEGTPIKGTFTVAFSVMPNTAGVSFCGGPPLANIVEAHGSGSSSLGALSFSLQKTVGPTLHGCLTLTAPNGDTLLAIYDGTQGAPNANNFRDGAGTLTFTGGTGRFAGASGTADFTVVFSRIGGTADPIQGMAFYSVDGTMSLQQGDQ